MISVSVIIINYNTSAYIERLLESICRNLELRHFEFIIVDNNSADKSFKLLKEKYPFLKIIENPENSGFASANNIAVKQTSGGYLLFLNPDVVIQDNSLMQLKNYYESNPGSGILSGLMQDDTGNPLYCFNEFWNLEWELYQAFGFGYDRRIRKLLSQNEIFSETAFQVDWFHGAFMFISKDVFEKVNGFNEKHFMYCEDVELCYDVRNHLGLKNICLPSVKYIHETRATFKESSDDDLYFFHTIRGKLIFIQNYNFFYRNLIKLISVFGVLFRIIRLPFWSKFEHRKKSKLIQLLLILKLHFSNNYLLNSKFEFVR